MQLTRRQFTKYLTASAMAANVSRRAFAVGGSNFHLGLNTYSLRALPEAVAIPTIIRVMREQKLQRCQLLFTHVEPAFGMVFPPTSANRTAAPAPPTPQQLEQRKAAAAERTEWRLSAPMSYFETIRSTFQRNGLQINAFATSFGSSEEELDRQFLMATALGAEAINGRVPEPMTDLVAAASRKHRLHVGIQVSDVKLLEAQLKTSRYMKADPDAGDLTRASINALGFVRTYAPQMDSIDLKDTIAGTGSVPFGEGHADLAGILAFLAKRQLPITAYIDCDYPGTGTSTDEVASCAAYLRRSLSSALR
ncbi:hypothetical protein [Terriglobus roseus]|uniref:Sugar phosphate isomerase/epimerase n=1 Tax=Terriglobus roseus TaxID=392734 RepID=A0A1H4JYG4_9BACT|nr:hypothetical protein [Terriglobus roseus]SEB51331.1 hypothetical protein SAMN05443244_0896 [Terriglobus roseus]